MPGEQPGGGQVLREAWQPKATPAHSFCKSPMLIHGGSTGYPQGTAVLLFGISVLALIAQ